MSNRIVTFLSAILLASSAVACTTEDGLDDVTSIEANSWGDLSSRPSFELWKSSDGQFRFHLLDADQEVLVVSQGYGNRTNALGGLLSVLENGKQPGQYDLLTASNGGGYFNLMAANKAIIATSGVHASLDRARNELNETVAAMNGYQKAWDTATGARFAIKQDVGGKWYFNLHAKNGAIVLRSQRYDAKASALNGAFSVADNGLSAARYQVMASSNGTGYYLNLTATNGQVIATSEVYSSKSNAERARDSIIELLPVVPLL
jgi:uncharacterized protein YegP (UPF0339 family)